MSILMIIRLLAMIVATVAVITISPVIGIAVGLIFLEQFILGSLFVESGRRIMNLQKQVGMLLEGELKKEVKNFKELLKKLEDENN